VSERSAGESGIARASVRHADADTALTRGGDANRCCCVRAQSARLFLGDKQERTAAQ